MGTKQFAAHAPRPMAMHDTTQLERDMRAERRAFFAALVICAGSLLALAANYGLIPWGLS